MITEVFTLGRNGLEKLEERENLPINSRVYSFGAGMSDAVWAVRDNDNNLVKISTNYDDDYFSSPYHKFDKYDRPLSKKFGIGFYNDDINSEFRFTDKEVKEAIERADKFIIEQKEKQRIETEKNQKEIDNLPKLYPHLTPLTDRHDKKDIKNNLIADLKKNFPNVKFSVRCEHYDTYNVSWVNGVTTDKVCKITNKFEDHVNDWSDYRDYEPSNFNKVFGGFKYIFENRKYCDKIEALYSKDYNKDQEYNSQLNEVLWKTDIPSNFETVEFINGELIFTLPEKEDNKPDLIDANNTSIKTNDLNTDISIIDYSDKAIAVIGNTKPIKDQLKALGGKFNFRLTCGVGWIFAKTKREEVEKLIGVL